MQICGTNHTPTRVTRRWEIVSKVHFCKRETACPVLTKAFLQPYTIATMYFAIFLCLTILLASWAEHWVVETLHKVDQIDPESTLGITGIIITDVLFCRAKRKTKKKKPSWKLCSTYYAPQACCLRFTPVSTVANTAASELGRKRNYSLSWTDQGNARYRVVISKDLL